MGSHRPEIQEGYFSYLQGSHLIFYLQGEGGIVIIGLPHRCMDVGDTFPEETSFLRFSRFHAAHGNQGEEISPFDRDDIGVVRAFGVKGSPQWRGKP